MTRASRPPATLLIVGLVLPFLLGPSVAQNRIAAPVTPCVALRAAISRAGALIVDTGRYTFDRVVRDGGFCPLEETTKPAYVPSADVPQCFVGYRCVDKFTEQRDRY